MFLLLLLLCDGFLFTHLHANVISSCITDQCLVAQAHKVLNALAHSYSFQGDITIVACLEDNVCGFTNMV